MIVNHDVSKAIDQLSPDKAKLIELWHFDPPWPYGQTHRTGNVNYAAMSFVDISLLIQKAYYLANDESFMILWMTFPMLMDSDFNHLKDVFPWEGYSGGVWAKTSGFGTGNVVRGDAEFALIYRKGKPKRTGRAYSNLWLADRKGHSEKPQVSLRGMLSSMTTEGGYVFDAEAPVFYNDGTFKLVTI